MTYRIFTFLFMVSLLATCTKPDGEIVIDNPNDVIAVQSSCNAISNIRNMYLADAYRLALRTTQADNSSIWQDSVLISPELVTDIHGAIIAVHNALEMVYRDTVIAHYGIHSLPTPDLNGMLVKVDISKGWVQNWIQGVQSAHPAIDEMSDSYQLRFAGYYQWPIGNYVKLESDLNLNIAALTEHFKTIDGVLDAQVDTEPGDGNDISYTSRSQDGVRELIYSAGYTPGMEECQNQCTKRRYWKFWVKNSNCSVEYKGSWGDLPPLL